MDNANEFFPEGYEIPEKVGSYMKLAEGRNTFRALSSPIIGFEWWVESEGKRSPKRVKTLDEVPVAVKQNQESKHFWAFTVWNYDDKAIQILELTQASIMKSIKEYIDNAKWGSPKAYDLVIIRRKTGPEAMNVEYTVQAEPKEELAKDIADQFKSASIDLDALYRSEDPFAAVVKDTPDEEVNPF